MIAPDQFSNLPDDLLFVFSSREDGTMLDRTRDFHNSEIVGNRRTFCAKNGIDYDHGAVYQTIIYSDEADYETLKIADTSGGQITADGIFTRTPGVALFLPVADCIVTVLYDPLKHSLALLHLGRHATLSNLLPKTIALFVENGSKTSDVKVWMAPSVAKESYRLEYFDRADDPSWADFCVKRDDGYYIDMRGYNKNVCLMSGILNENITISPINTATDSNYFSHSQGDTTERFAGLVMMR